MGVGSADTRIVGRRDVFDVIEHRLNVKWRSFVGGKDSWSAGCDTFSGGRLSTAGIALIVSEVVGTDRVGTVVFWADMMGQNTSRKEIRIVK